MEKKTVNQITFGQRLAYTRNKKGLLQKQLAELIGAGHSTVTCWEEDRRHPNKIMIQKLTQALNVSDDWFENDDNFNAISQSMKTTEKLTKEQQKLVADNEKVIGAVFQRFVRKYHPAVESYEDLYGDAAINLCRAAKMFGEQHCSKDKFFVYAFVYVKWAMFNSYMKKERYLHRTTSLNKIIGQDDHGTDVELGETIPSPDDEYERIEYRILAESAYQKVEPVLGKKEKEAFRLWLLGNENPEIARVLGVSQHTSLCRILRAKTKCRDSFNADEIFS